MVEPEEGKYMREECVEILKGNSLGRWNDNNCNDEMSFVCKKNQNPSIEKGLEVNNNKKCKSGWKQVI